MNLRHGTTRTRMKEAKEMAHYLSEHMKEIETLWLMSEAGEISEEFADERIRALSEEVPMFVETFKSKTTYLEIK